MGDNKRVYVSQISSFEGAVSLGFTCRTSLQGMYAVLCNPVTFSSVNNISVSHFSVILQLYLENFFLALFFFLKQPYCLNLKLVHVFFYHVFIMTG